MKRKMRLGEILNKIQVLSDDDLKKYLEVQQNSDIKLGELLFRERALTKEQLIPVLEFQLGVKYIDLLNIKIEDTALRAVNESIARKHKLIPIDFQGEYLRVAMSDPVDLMAQDDVRIMTGFKLEIYFSFEPEIERAINMYYSNFGEAEKAFEELEQEGEEEIATATAAAEEETEEVARAPIVRLVNSMFSQAVRSKTSDIHIEPFENSLKVRFRVDGSLKEVMSPPKSSQNALTSRLKIMSGLDIAEKRIPQDGRIEAIIEKRPIDMRVSVLPTVYGEKIVIRLLDRASINITKEQLGFTQHNIALFDKIIKAPEGIILITGPTGSGKTTTLYAVLRELSQPNVNIVTVEDPVEYRLEGVNQVQVNNKAGLTFAAGLRSILRQDPDIVMIGEIRDGETAEIASRAAITGHVVLSTIHTNDTVSTISRLIDMGIEKFMVSSAVVGIVAQRLVKRVCHNCKTQRLTTEEEMAVLKLNKAVYINEGTGCNLCGDSGYSGRIAIHEILVMDRDIKSAINKDTTTDIIKEEARRKGMKTLSESCRELVLEGITSVSEMLRVTYSVDE